MKPKIKKRGEFWQISYGTFSPGPYTSIAVGTWQEAMSIGNKVAGRPVFSLFDVGILRFIGKQLDPTFTVKE